MLPYFHRDRNISSLLKGIVIYVLGFSACASLPAAEIIHVSIRNTAFEDLRVIEQQEQLAQFRQLWEKKHKSDPVKIRWQYLLDIRSTSKGVVREIRWRYHPDGWVQVLGMKVANMYRLSNPQAFNALLGIEPTPKP